MNSALCIEQQVPSGLVVLKGEPQPKPANVVDIKDVVLHAKARRIAKLLAGYMRDTLTPAEHDELDEWVGASDKNMKLFEELTDENRVRLALELLNDQEPMVKKLLSDKYRFEKPVFYRVRILLCKLKWWLWG